MPDSPDFKKARLRGFRRVTDGRINSDVAYGQSHILQFLRGFLSGEFWHRGEITLKDAPQDFPSALSLMVIAYIHMHICL